MENLIPKLPELAYKLVKEDFEQERKTKVNVSTAWSDKKIK